MPEFKKWKITQKQEADAGIQDMQSSSIKLNHYK